MHRAPLLRQVAPRIDPCPTLPNTTIYADRLGGWTRHEVPLLLRVVAVALFVVPANMVVEPIGAVGYVVALLSMLVFFLWLASAAFGVHDPIPHRHPARVGLALFWLATCASYVGMIGKSTTVLAQALSLIHISEPTRRTPISYAVFCL